MSVDGAAVTALDSAGAWLLLQLGKRIEAAGGQMTLQSFRPSWLRLVEFIAAEAQDAERVLAPRRKTPLAERVAGIGGDLTGFLAFIGESVLSLLGAVRHPGRVRWQELLDDMWQTGVNALPIVGLLSFLMGVVIAYQGAVQLKLYGANIYIADLVGYSMLRELAPLLTAILICGRTGSAYAAKIGTMQVREEVAALQTIGIPPVDLLVLPKLLSLFVVLPLLTVYADVLAVFGGMFMANAQLGIGYHAFIGTSRGSHHLLDLHDRRRQGAGVCRHHRHRRLLSGLQGGRQCGECRPSYHYQRGAVDLSGDYRGCHVFRAVQHDGCVSVMPGNQDAATDMPATGDA